jgi:cell division septum initiation protein DivIVA
MDILHLIDRLEELFNDSRPIPLTSNVIVDEDRMLDLIDQMRIAIPDAVKQAQKLMSEKDRTLAQAQEEASRTLKLARDRSDGMLDREAIVEAAQSRADQVVSQARIEADLIRQEADDYTLESLTSLEIELERLNNQVRNGIRALQEQSTEHQHNNDKQPLEEAGAD